MKEISLDFIGYKRDCNKSSLEDKSGIYCVYCCAYNSSNDKVSLKKLLYIGEADSIHDRLENHEQYSTWESYLKSGEELCYTRAFISGDDKFRAEAALIYKHKPPVNIEHKDHFGYPDTKMVLTGRTALLTTTFTVFDDR